MTTMTQTREVVTVGVDTHRDFHVAAVVDHNGGLLATETFQASRGGYRQLARWASSFGEVEAAGVEGTGAWGKGLTRFLTEEGIPVIEVSRPNRQHRRRYGKSDTNDAVAAARAVLSGEADAVPRGEGPSEALRLLRVARRSAVKQRTRLASQMNAVVVTAPDDLRSQLAGLDTEQLAVKAARFRPDTNISDPYTAAKTSLKVMAVQYLQLGEDIDGLTSHYQTIVKAHAPAELLDMVGVGPVCAADLMITQGTAGDRITSESAFAAVCGVSAVEASSGERIRHRLNRGGDRQANAALYRIVVVRLKYDPETQAYMQRRTDQGRTKKEIIRCLKRYVARDIYWIFQRHQQATCGL